MNKIIFITGSSGAGKTTISGKLAERFAKSVHINTDNLRESVVSGRAVLGAWTDEATKQCQLSRTTATHMAKLYAANGFDVVVDDVCVPECFADQYAELFTHTVTDTISFCKVLLLPQRDVINERIRQRGGPYVQFFIENSTPWLYSYLEPMPKAGWIVIDSSNLTIEQTTEEVWQRINLHA